LPIILFNNPIEDAISDFPVRGRSQKVALGIEPGPKGQDHFQFQNEKGPRIDLLSSEFQFSHVVIKLGQLRGRDALEIGIGQSDQIDHLAAVGSIRVIVGRSLNGDVVQTILVAAAVPVSFVKANAVVVIVVIVVVVTVVVVVIVVVVIIFIDLFY